MLQLGFKRWHSLAGVTGLLVVEGLLIWMLGASSASTYVIAGAAILGGTAIVAVATEVVEDVESATRMFVFLGGVVAEFLVFFAFQYGFLMYLDPSSFAELSTDALSLLLQSTMVFALNPLYDPETTGAKLLMLIHTLSALAIALFVLQNIGSLRGKSGK